MFACLDTVAVYKLQYLSAICDYVLVIIVVVGTSQIHETHGESLRVPLVARNTDIDSPSVLHRVVSAKFSYFFGVFENMPHLVDKAGDYFIESAIWKVCAHNQNTFLHLIMPPKMCV